MVICNFTEIINKSYLEGDDILGGKKRMEFKQLDIKRSGREIFHKRKKQMPKT